MTAAEQLDRDFGVIVELIAHTAARRGDHTALVLGERGLAFAALDDLMNRVAASLQRDGLRPNDVVAICAETSIEYAAVFLGALRAGIAVAPLAASSSVRGLKAMLEDCGAKRVFVSAAVVRTLGEALEDLATVALDDGPGGAPFGGWLVPPGTTPEPVAIAPDWPCIMIYSSGTTGAPKGIVQPYSMRWSNLRRALAFGVDEASVTVVSTPLYSNTTLASFLPSVLLGGTTVLMPKFDASGFLALAERHRATHAMLVPVQYQRIMALPDFDSYDLSSFAMKLSTSAPFPAALKADVLKRWPGGLVEIYGMTEGGGSCLLFAHRHPDKLHTVGRPTPGHDFRVIDEDRRELPPGAVGEIVGHSAGMMRGYHNQPAKTAEAEWFDASGKRFIRTGDVGRFDEDGFLTLLDRKKDMIISGGFNIYPSDLEAVLAEHAAVAEAAVVGVPSAEWGETPVAFVVLRSGAAIGAEDLRAFANARLGKTQRLARVEIVATLPRSSIGKVLKRELRESGSR